MALDLRLMMAEAKEDLYVAIKGGNQTNHDPYWQDSKGNFGIPDCFRIDPVAQKAKMKIKIVVTLLRFTICLYGSK